MPKNIVLLSDGTGNSAAKLQKTNVWRTYESLALTDPARQVACYDDGVGTSSFKPLALLGGIFGFGLKRNVLRLYRFLCEHYEPGDRIFVFGFSRGAFTVRVLADLIADQGVIRTRPSAPEAPPPGTPDPDAPEAPEPGTPAAPGMNGEVFGPELARLAEWAYRDYRRNFNPTGKLVAAARALRNLVLRALEAGKPGYDKAGNHEVEAIEFVGVWDTVDAYGLPVDELTDGIDRWIWPLSMPNHRLSPKVQKACHAVALDDERNTFHPVLWDEAEEAPESLAAARLEDERISQVWFAGMHSNVGGGYADDALSFVSFRWMTDQARLRGLRFSQVLLDLHAARADTLGRVYDSRRGVAGYYRYNPRKIEWLTNRQVHEQGFGGRWPKPHPTVTVPRPKIHESVVERIKAAPEAYAPIGFPARYAVVTEDGRILDGPAHPLETAEVSQRRVRAQEAAWDLVWWRRLVYFTTVAVTLTVLARPFGNAAAAEAVETNAAGRAVAAVGGLLPGFASPWVEYYTARPLELVIGLGLVLALMLIGRRLQGRICNRMRGLWLQAVVGRPEALAEPRGLLVRLRSHPWYQGAFAVLRRKLLPAVTGLGALLLLVVLAVRAPFDLANAAGRICDGKTRAGGSLGFPFRFASRDLCTATGVQIEEGKRYRVVLQLPGTGEEAWQDSTIPVSSPAGFTSRKPGLTPVQRVIFSVFAPFRRVVGADWFVPIARIGRSGPDLRLTSTRSVFTAPASGELHLFVNDAVLPPWRSYYDNNKGAATATVERVEE